MIVGVSLRWRLACLAVLPVFVGEALSAQVGTLAVTGDQDLQFGTVLPGLATQVSPMDPANAGRFEVRGERDLEVVIQLTLPLALVAPDGSVIPLAFGTTDGSWGTRPSLPASRAFDPTVPLAAQLGRSGRLYLRLGATAQPIPAQTPGEYTGSITVTVAYTGN